MFTICTLAVALALVISALCGHIGYLKAELKDARADRDAANKWSADLLQQRITDTYAAADQINAILDRHAAATKES